MKVHTSQSAINEQLGLVALSDEAGSDFRVFDFKNQRVVCKPQSGRVEGIKWSGDIVGAIIYGGVHHPKSGVLLWDGKTRKPLPSPPADNVTYISFSFNSDNKTIAAVRLKPQSEADSAAKGKYELMAWDYRLNRVLWRHDVDPVLYKAQWSPDGTWLMLITATEDGSTQLCVFDRTGELCIKRNIDSSATAWSPDSKQIATISRQGSLKRIELVQVWE